MGGIERIEFPEADFDALIFDLDGTLVDSMPVHFESWCKALEIYGAAGILGEDVFYAMGGRPTHDIVVDLNGSDLLCQAGVVPEQSAKCGTL